MSIATHPEATSDPQTLNWRIAPGLLPWVGEVTSTPPALQRLVDDGIVSGLRLDPDSLAVTLAPGLSWAREGSTLRAAILAALDQTDGWCVASGEDTMLSRCVQQVLEGPAGDYVRSHGGSVQIDRIDGPVVWLGMTGTCQSCPALRFTVQGTIERELRKLCAQPFELHVSGRF